MRNKFLPSFWQWLILIILLLIAISATEALVKHEQQHARSLQLRHEIASAGQLRALIESELNIPLYLTIGLTAHVQANNGDISPAEIHLLLPELVHQARHIRNIGIAPGNTLRYLYPSTGHEHAMGLHYPDLKDQWPDMQAVITEREARLVGPVSILQGGMGFIYRLPVFMNANSYWGMISTVVNIDSVWELLKQQTSEQEVQVAIRSLSPKGLASAAFYGDERLFHDDSMLIAINLRGALWQMAVRSLNPPLDYTKTIRTTAYSVTALLLALLCWLFMSRQHLRNSVAEQQRNKLQLTSIMDNVADAIITTTPDGFIEQVNLSGYRMFGYIAATLPGMHWSALLAEPKQLDEVYTATHDHHAEFETIGRRHDSSLFPLAVRRSTVRLQRQSRQLLVLRDLSDQQRTEQLKQEFISTISHELRTPLTSITGALGLATGGALGELNSSQLRILQLAKNNCQQLSKLVNTLLDVEKLASGNLQFELSELAVLPLLQQCIDEQQILAQPQQVSLRLSCPTYLQQVLVHADVTRLKQVLLHLLANAVKFSPADSTVQISLQLQQLRLRISIADQGEGVSEPLVAKLFSRYSPADHSGNPLHSSTGLGLAVSKNIINHMHGDIGYMPNTPKGSCFYIELPFDASIQPGELP